MFLEIFLFVLWLVFQWISRKMISVGCQTDCSLECDNFCAGSVAGEDFVVDEVTVNHLVEEDVVVVPPVEPVIPVVTLLVAMRIRVYLPWCLVAAGWHVNPHQFHVADKVLVKAPPRSWTIYTLVPTR